MSCDAITTGIWPKWPGGWLTKQSPPPPRRPSHSPRAAGTPTARVGGPDIDDHAERATGERPLRLPSHIILVGLPGAGKTSVGSMLARSLDCPFVDLDAEIVRHTGRAISAIFASRRRAALPNAGTGRDLATPRRAALRGCPRRRVGHRAGYRGALAAAGPYDLSQGRSRDRGPPAASVRCILRPLLRQDPHGALLRSSSTCGVRRTRRPTG